MAAGQNLSVFTSLRESGASRSEASHAGRRVYRGVTIIKAGLGNQRDRNYYPPETLQRAVAEGQFKNLKAYADHQDSVSEEVQPERTIRDMVGVYKHPRFLNEGKGGRVVADLHLFRSSKWLADTIDDLIELKQADNIGLSINGRGQTVEKQIQLAESESPVNVNWVEAFTRVRSADVVTEAGAGGGFQELLESARGTAARENKMKRLSEAQKNSIKAAVDSNDTEKLLAVLAECGCTAAPAKAKESADKKKPAAKDDAVADDVEEADEDTDDVEEPDADAELDEAVEEAKRKADEAADETDADEAEAAEGDVDEADEADEADEDDEAEEDVAEAGMGHLPGGAGKIAGGAPKGKGGSAVKPAKRQGTAQKGRRFGEAATKELTSRERKLMEANARLSAQLRVRTTADRARNLLRESAIPEKMRPEILPLMIGKSEDEMRKVIRYHERLIATAIAEATGYDSDVEGVGSTTFRESNGGRGGGVDALIEGLPRK